MPMSDKEQIQMIKDWWKKYGNSALFTLLFIVFANFGWRYWQQYKHRHLEQASITYEQMLGALRQHKNEEFNLYAKHLLQDYARSPYTSLTSFILAKISVQKGDLKQAQEQLQFVINKSSSKTLRQVARIRIARILIANKQPQPALDLLKKVDDKAYLAEIYEISGDAWLALGNLTEAKQAYQQAKSAIIGVAKSPLLQRKMQQF